jgi:radical SAM-linked protein
VRCGGGEKDITVCSKGQKSELWYRVAIRFRVDGDLRFISHHDTMRLFERALSRAQLPVRYSEGFNPRPKMSLPLPRPVGVATEADMLVFELREPVDAAEAMTRLAQQMPGGLVLLEALALESHGKLHPEQVVYEVALSSEQVDAARPAVERLLAAEHWPVERSDERGRPLRSIDLRPMLVEVSVEPDALRWTCRVPDNGSARPGEWLQAFGLDARALLHRVRRIAVHWQSEAHTSPEPEPAPSAEA